MWKSVTTIVVIRDDQNRCEELTRKRRNDTLLKQKSAKMSAEQITKDRSGVLALFESHPVKGTGRK